MVTPPVDTKPVDPKPVDSKPAAKSGGVVASLAAGLSGTKSSGVGGGIGAFWKAKTAETSDAPAAASTATTTTTTKSSTATVTKPFKLPPPIAVAAPAVTTPAAAAPTHPLGFAGPSLPPKKLASTGVRNGIAPAAASDTAASPATATPTTPATATTPSPSSSDEPPAPATAPPPPVKPSSKPSLSAFQPGGLPMGRSRVGASAEPPSRFQPPPAQQASQPPLPAAPRPVKQSPTNRPYNSSTLPAGLTFGASSSGSSTGTASGGAPGGHTRTPSTGVAALAASLNSRGIQIQLGKPPPRLPPPLVKEEAGDAEADDAGPGQLVHTRRAKPVGRSRNSSAVSRGTFVPTHAANK